MTPTAVVVGGASGIGLATARVLAAEGFSVVVADVNSDAALAAAEEIGGRAVTLDVTDESSVAAGFASVDELEAVVSCAGLTVPGALTELGLDQWQTSIDVCLTGSFLVLKHAGQRMVDGGSITVISSLNGRQPGAGMGAYCAAKAGVTMLVEVAALELAPRKIRVNAISPGLVDTPLTEGLALVPGLVDEYLENTPLGRSGRPEEVADMAAYLASEKAAWITGSAFDLNGGAHLQRYPDVLGKIRALSS
ncbi:SDR family NAD(P)-dependent oxidoreductase [Gordonia sp. Z-3]|jgi:NAD(P)-dependent dehydrogenase (short-subunit alcohol dehydrogenase family)|uniref:SDR family oxidoreductase n=1 Tax=Gordonia tangerina TaxID=2911060 RepID=A0ABS9DI08_9ACTN|nr:MULTISPECIES: SDR family NAD(P)-dependent oxidoreductase [Gordonia]MAU81623.1 short-chain dehydrogenase [Gordonia sp. (in: high G+C Gram-positive bacteria)]MCF3938777.1 SDR family oxidoreductase [Gordonia tangerina]MED5802421.1 SDR family NAD(P)-dependent oxidoreductase [Gordonia sp. Z-3]